MCSYLYCMQHMHTKLHAMSSCCDQSNTPQGCTNRIVTLRPLLLSMHSMHDFDTYAVLLAVQQSIT
jgi:hypothetical protein